MEVNNICNENINKIIKAFVLINFITFVEKYFKPINMKKNLTILIMLSIFGLSSAFAQIPTNGLLAWYKFDGTANDSSGNNNNGVINGPTSTTDRFNRPNHALLFNGDGQYVSVANDVWSDSLTLSAWVYANYFGSTSSGTAGKMIFFKAPNTGYNDDYHMCVIYDGSNNPKAQFVFGQGSGQYIPLTSNTILQTNQWYLITATRANGVAKLYINGNLEITTNYSFTPINEHYSLRLGMSVSNGQSFSGKLDEMRIYNRALNAQEIIDIYNEQPPKEMIAWYPCDNNALDLSGNNYNGNIYGATGTTNRFNQTNKALLFNGNGQYINVPYDIWSSDLTLSAWIYANDFGSTSSSNAGKMIFYKAQDMSYNQDYNLFVYYDASGNARAQFYFGQSSSQTVPLISNTILQTNQWYLITATRENGVAKLYINASLDASATYTFTPVNQNFNLTLGMSYSSFQSFSGKLDELRVYDYALNIGQIDSLYNDQSYSVNDYVDLDNNVKIYPNPVKDKLTIETNFNKEQNLEIINLVGQTIYTSIINKRATVNTSAFAKGIYILKLSSDREVLVKKFVIE